MSLSAQKQHCFGVLEFFKFSKAKKRKHFFWNFCNSWDDGKDYIGIRLKAQDHTCKSCDLVGARINWREVHMEIFLFDTSLGECQEFSICHLCTFRNWDDNKADYIGIGLKIQRTNWTILKYKD